MPFGMFGHRHCMSSARRHATGNRRPGSDTTRLNARCSSLILNVSSLVVVVVVGCSAASVRGSPISSNVVTMRNRQKPASLPGCLPSLRRQTDGQTRLLDWWCTWQVSLQ